MIAERLEQRAPSRNVPALGTRISRGGVIVEHVPPLFHEVNFKVDVDVITFALGPGDWTRAFDSDRPSPLSFLPGQAAFHPAGAHVVAWSEGERRQNIMVLALPPSLRKACAEELPARARPSFDHVYTGVSSENTLALAQLARRLHTTGRLDNALAAQSLATLMLEDVVSAVATTAAAGPVALPRAMLNKTMDYIDAHLADNFGLAELAAVAGLGTSAFSRSFKEATGLSPHQYVMERRVTRARERIVGGGDTLADIAYAVGFSSQAHMTDVFCKKLGVTPGRHRRETVH